MQESNCESPQEEIARRSARGRRSEGELLTIFEPYTPVTLSSQQSALVSCIMGVVATVMSAWDLLFRRAQAFINRFNASEANMEAQVCLS